ncbi:MAG: hypothetical protein CL920_31195 [Deltaproteobacteria bacterium]|nr:hypothetical protein [Deltaproteobacteria bacterium]
MVLFVVEKEKGNEMSFCGRKMGFGLVENGHGGGGLTLYSVEGRKEGDIWWRYGAAEAVFF